MLAAAGLLNGKRVTKHRYFSYSLQPVSGVEVLAGHARVLGRQQLIAGNSCHLHRIVLRFDLDQKNLGFCSFLE